MFTLPSRVHLSLPPGAGRLGGGRGGAAVGLPPPPTRPEAASRGRTRLHGHQRDRGGLGRGWGGFYGHKWRGVEVEGWLLRSHGAGFQPPWLGLFLNASGLLRFLPLLLLTRRFTRNFCGVQVLRR
jgi:hypothetical protein